MNPGPSAERRRAFVSPARGALVPVLLALVVATPTAAARPRPDDPLAPLSLIAGQVLLQWQVPGAAVVVVRRDAPDLVRTFGRRELRVGQPVTGSTLFAVGSVTKGITSAGLALLVAEGRLDWDDTVRSHLPGFTLADSAASDQATIRDLLAHRTGMARHDLVWVGSPLTRDQLFDRLRFLEPLTGLREAWGYNNLMYMVAGMVAERVTGESWEQYTDRRLLRPLGMTRSLLATPHADTPDLAWPHRYSAGSVWETPFYDGWAIAPAGALHTSIRDLAAWLRFQLTGAGPDGRTLLPMAALEQLHRPVIEVPAASDPEITDRWSAMGWFVERYRGHRHVWHNGGIDGFYAQVGLLPDDGLGVAVVTNCSDNRAPEILSRWVFDVVLGLQPIDWNRRLQRLQGELELRRERRLRRRSTLADAAAAPKLPTAAYLGLYRHPAYGEITVRRQGPGLAATYRGVTVGLQHVGGEVFLRPADPRGFGDDLALRFLDDGRGRVRGLLSPMEPTVQPIFFERSGLPPDDASGQRASRRTSTPGRESAAASATSSRARSSTTCSSGGSSSS